MFCGGGGAGPLAQGLLGRLFGEDLARLGRRFGAGLEAVAILAIGLRLGTGNRGVSCFLPIEIGLAFLRQFVAEPALSPPAVAIAMTGRLAKLRDDVLFAPLVWILFPTFVRKALPGGARLTEFARPMVPGLAFFLLLEPCCFERLLAVITKFFTYSSSDP